MIPSWCVKIGDNVKPPTHHQGMQPLLNHCFFVVYRAWGHFQSCAPCVIAFAWKTTSILNKCSVVTKCFCSTSALFSHIVRVKLHLKMRVEHLGSRIVTALAVWLQLLTFAACHTPLSPSFAVWPLHCHF